MRIGLFGGTFDPPHQAHLAASLLALKRLKLDRVWWLVTPGNPLKNTSDLAPLHQRIAAARALTHHPRIDVTGLEAVIKTSYTYDTISWLLRPLPRRALRLDHGRGQFAEFPSLAELARNCGAGADRGGRPPGPEPLCRRQSRRPGLARARIPEHAAATLPDRKAAGLGLPARPEITAVLDRAARPARARGNLMPRQA